MYHQILFEGENMSAKILSENLTLNLLTEAEKCSNCGVCTAGCPLYAHTGIMPGDLLLKMAAEGKINPILPYSCTLCGYCRHICPKEVKIDQLMQELRRQAVTEKGVLPTGINYRPVKSHQKYSFSPLFSATFTPEKYTGTVFFPGCSLPAFRPDLTQKTYFYLQEKMEGTGIMFKCCANPTLDMGDEETFRRYYEQLEEEFKKYAVKKVITACPNCYSLIKEKSPYLEVVSLWEIIASLGVPERAAKTEAGRDLKPALHDPCPTRSYPAIHDSVRSILNSLGTEFAEFKFNRQKTLCCGAGGMLSITNPHLASAWMKKRSLEAPSELIITYCQECVVSLQKGGKKTRHLLDLIFYPDGSNKETKNPGVVRRWYHRYKTKKFFKNLIERRP